MRSEKFLERLNHWRHQPANESGDNHSRLVREASRILWWIAAARRWYVWRVVIIAHSSWDCFCLSDFRRGEALGLIGFPIIGVMVLENLCFDFLFFLFV